MGRKVGLWCLAGKPVLWSRLTRIGKQACAVPEEQMPISLIHRAFHSPQAWMSETGAPGLESFLLEVSVMLASGPTYFSSFNCLGGKQRDFDFIISPELLV